MLYTPNEKSNQSFIKYKTCVTFFSVVICVNFLIEDGSTTMYRNYCQNFLYIPPIYTFLLSFNGFFLYSKGL